MYKFSANLLKADLVSKKIKSKEKLVVNIKKTTFKKFFIKYLRKNKLN